MHEEQGMVLLYFCHVRSATMLPVMMRIGAIMCLVASAIAIEAVVIAVGPTIAVGGPWLVSTAMIFYTTMIVALGLALIDAMRTSTLISLFLGRPGHLLLLLLVEGPPLLGGVEELPSSRLCF